MAIATLALGIGANTAIFSLLNAVVLRPLAVPRPEQLVAIATAIPDDTNGDQPLSLPMFLEMERQHLGLSDLFAWYGDAISNLEANGRTVTAGLASVSGNYYSAMRIAPLLGRFITSGDVALTSGNSSTVAVISYRAWRAWYRGDSNVVGKTIRIENRPFTIIGVEPEGYSGLIIDGSADVTVSLFAFAKGEGQNMRNPRLLWLRVYGRLLPNRTLSQARARLKTAWPHIQEATRPPGYEGERKARFFARRVTMESAATGFSFLRTRFSFSLRVLLALVGAVLLIACLNLANLSLARAVARQHDWGVRAALGATVFDLTRQPVIESLMISFSGALIGLALAYAMSRAMLHVAWTGLVSTPLSTSLDGRVLSFTAAIAVGTGLLFAIAPTWFAARTDPIDALKSQTRSVRGGSTLLGRMFCVAQISLSLVLVAGALLFGRTLRALHTTDVGYRRDHLLTMLLFPQAGRRRINDSGAYYKQLADRLRRLPGVSGVSFSASGPANEMDYFDPVQRSATHPSVQAVGDFVGPDFFSIAGMRVVRGHEFGWRDSDLQQQIVIISQNLAEALFGHENPIGRTLFLGPIAYRDQATIVGVVSNASLWKVESPAPMAFFRPITKTWGDGDPLVDIRTTGEPGALKTAAEEAVRSLGRHYSLRTMSVEERLDSYITAQRLTAMLAAFFGAIALLIAAVGLYGLMSFEVTRRTAELGVRVALGAQRQQVVSIVLWEALLLGCVGCILGLVVSLAMGRLVESLLFGISGSDPATFASAAAALLFVSLLASFAPALRAASLDPIKALREE